MLLVILGMFGLLVYVRWVIIVISTLFGMIAFGFLAGLGVGVVMWLFIKAMSAVILTTAVGAAITEKEKADDNRG